MNSSNDPIHTLLKAPIFEGLRLEDLEVLRPAVRLRRFNRGVYLFREGDPGSHLYMVTRGQVKIGSVGEGGGEVVFAIAGPGEIYKGAVARQKHFAWADIPSALVQQWEAARQRAD